MRSGSIRYGRCANACEQRTNWRFVSVPNAPGREVTMAVSSSGKVALMWANFTPEQLGYSECTASDCSMASGWRSFTLPADIPTIRSNAVFDQNGVFHVVIDQAFTDDTLLTCPGNCTGSNASWFAVPTGMSGVYSSIAVDRGGSLGIASVDVSANVRFRTVTVANTNGQLTNAFSPTTAVIANDAWIGAGVDLVYANGRPRLSFISSTRATRLAWCSANCATSTNWDSIQFNNARPSPSPSSTLTVNASDVPTVVRVVGDELLAIRCTSGSCYSLSGLYSNMTADTHAQAYSSQRFPLPTNCKPNEVPFASSFTGDFSRAVTVGGRTEIITVAFDVGGCNVNEGVQANWHLRYAVVP
ncbi:MAG: hypothetical protein SFW67_31125 [Myxococcaceae bacterium]|nr:hypothetical protein [Myxococcaceae bacterium]